MSISTSLLAAFLFARHYKIKENTKLSFLKKIANNECLGAVLEDLQHYGGIYVKDHVITVKLTKSPNDKLFTCEITHSYKKIGNGSDLLSFVIYRVNNVNQDVPNLAEECLNKEFVWINDERDMVGSNVNKDYYKVDMVLLNKTEQIALKREDRGEVIYFEGKAKENHKNNETEYSYVVSIPVEKESYIFVTHDFPTKGATIKFNYSDVYSKVKLS